MKNKLVTISYALLALAFPVAVLSGKLAELYLKQSNPNSIDITTKIAYSNQATIVIAGIFTLMILSASVCAVAARKNENGNGFVKQVLILSVLSVALVASIYLVQSRITTIEKNYTQERLKNFWPKLSL